MKKLLTLALICILGLAGCSKAGEDKWDMIPMVMVDGTLYLDTGHNNTDIRKCGTPDGEITSTVDGTEKPAEDNQSNFGSGYGYQYGMTEGTIEIYMNDAWRIFATEEVRQQIQFPENNFSNQGAAPEAYAFEAQYICTNGYSEDRSYPYHVVIDSKEELEAYYEANKDFFDLERKEKVYSDTTIGFLDACDKYDDTYFERQNLVLIILEEGSGSIRHEITDVRRRWDENGASLGWNITIKTMAPEVVTDDMAEWHLFLEVQMGNVIKDGDDVWINDKLSSNANKK